MVAFPRANWAVLGRRRVFVVSAHINRVIGRFVPGSPQDGRSGIKEVAVGGGRGIDGSDHRGVIGLVNKVGIQSVEVAIDTSGTGTIVSSRVALRRNSRGAIFPGFSVGISEKEWMERGLGAGGAGCVVLGSAYILDRTITDDILGNSAIRGRCFRSVGLAITFHRCEYDRTRAC